MLLPVTHNELLARLNECAPSRVKAQRVLDALRAELDPPEKGKLVGEDSLDYSFRLSLIWHSEGGTTGPRPFPTRGIIQSILHPCKVKYVHPVYGPIGQRMSYARHHHVDTVAVSDEGLRRWTKWAKSIGLRHDGKWGYQFPPKRVWNTDRKVLDLLQGVFYLPPKTKRSQSSSKRRKERRSLLQRVRTATCPQSPVSYRLLYSQKTLRKCWSSLPSPDWVPWPVYKARCGNKKVPVPSGLDGRYHGPMPDAVLCALTKIYSRKTIYPKVVKRDTFPEVQVVTPAFDESSYTCIKDRLQQIEDNGFKETYTWFFLNHQLSKTAV